MRRADLPAAWRLADAALAARDLARRDDPTLPYHRRWVWDGTAPKGREVLVRCYHGLGDTLQFVRFLPALRRNAARVTLEAQPELLPMLAGQPGIDRLLAFDPSRPAPPAACDVEIMELAHLLRVDAAALWSGAYLAPPPAARPRAGAVGLCWRAGDWDPDRSVPLAALRAVCAGRPLVSLQRGAGAAEAGVGFVNPGDSSTDILATARLLASVDMVVTVDTMVAHLAGALGRPTLLLLKAEADWRWPAADGPSAWYPGTECLHQRAPGDWRAPLEGVCARLRQSEGSRG